MSAITQPRYARANGQVISNPDAALNLKQRENVGVVLPRSSPNAAMFANSGGQVIWEVPNNLVDNLDWLYLQFTITNNHGSAVCAPLDGYSFIDNILIENRGTAVQVLHGLALRKLMLLMTTTEKSTASLRQANLNSTTFTPYATIAAGGSLVFRIPLPVFLATCDVPLWRTENEFRITITFNGGPDVMLSTSGAAASDMGLSTMRMIFDGVLYEESTRRQFDRDLDSLGPITYKYIDGSRDQLSLGTTISGTVTQTNFNQTGNLAFAFLDLRANAGTNETRYTPLPMASFELLNNGQVVSHQMGENLYDYNLSKLISSTHWSNPLLLDTLNTCIVSFSDSPAASVSTGASYGNYRVTGTSEVWRINPTNSGVNSLFVWGFWHSNMKVDYGAKTIRIERKPLQ